jgi:glycosyltransferase involved in cell wall biosynthesis
MRSIPKISIVTPSFNQAEFLEPTMRSVLDQGYQNLEYAVIDAGSSDGSVEIIKKYASHLTYWVSEPDRSQADGINKGFSNTSGEIMGWINSSDVYYPWTLETIAQIFSEIPEAEWITGVATNLDLGTAPQSLTPAFWNVYDFLSGNYSWLQQESTFWRRSLWEQVGGKLEMKCACDFELWLRFMKCTTLYHVNTILAGYRYHDVRVGGSNNQQYRLVARQYFNSFYRSFGRRDQLRAMLIKSTNNSIGRIFRKFFMKTGIIPWYSHRKIIRDHQKKLWSVRE